MLRRIEPETILCYHQPFPEMKGNIVTISYDSSSWQSLQNGKGFETIDKPVIMVTKAGYVTGQWREKGSGSAYGGEWIPKKPEDERFLGKPGEIKVTYKSDGTRIETKIGPDGRAIKERHYTDKPNPKYHTNPHDHIINWDSPKPGQPNFQKPHINYTEEEYPNGAPEFKFYWGGDNVNTIVKRNSLEENRFKSISDFEDCMIRGGEVEFEWKGDTYGVSGTETAGEISIWKYGKPETERICHTPGEVLEYTVGEDRLRDVVTQVTVWDRTI